MGIQVYADVSGTSLARPFVDDAEEFAYLLATMAECAPSDFAEEVAESGPYGQGKDTAKFLRALADAVENT